MTISRQRWNEKGRGYAATLAHAKRMVVRWVAVNAERLRRKVLDERLGSLPTTDPMLTRVEQPTE
ncbi:hypothetical protein [Pseudoxanthomonas wuyuanensis]